MEKKEESFTTHRKRAQSQRPQVVYKTAPAPNDLQIETPYIASFRGPILISAPHSIRLKRGGHHTKSKERIHLREQWVSTLILKLVAEMEQIQLKNSIFASDFDYKKITRASFLFWSKEKKYDKFTLDPNYLVKSQLKDSKFHQGLHKFIESQIPATAPPKLSGSFLRKFPSA